MTHGKRRGRIILGDGSNGSSEKHRTRSVVAMDFCFRAEGGAAVTARWHHAQRRTAVAPLQPILITSPLLFLDTYPTWFSGLSRNTGSYRCPFCNCLPVWINQEIWLIQNMSKVTIHSWFPRETLVYASCFSRKNE